MNCECLNKIPAEMLQAENNQYNGRTIEAFSIVDVGLILSNGGQNISFSRLELQLCGLKKPKIVSLLHQFCPFCGVSVKPKEENEPR